MRLIVLIALALLPYMSMGQDSLAGAAALNDGKSHFRISLITCGPGEEIWETYGHACIRVVDSSRNDAERDKIYNYGFFEATEDNTIWQQAFTGRVVDLLDTITYEMLILEYTYKKRSLEEQVLLLTDEEKKSMVAFLKNNLRKENRYYEFDTYYDNCTTRIRDLFAKLFGNRFIPGQVILPGSQLTFRDASVNRYCGPQGKHWVGLAVNLIYGMHADKVMTNSEAMFLPVHLSAACRTATLNGRKMCAEKTVILGEHIEWPSKANGPFFCMMLIAAVVMPSLFYTRHPVAGTIATNIMLLVTGLLGCFLLRLWLLNGEPGWKNNLNILWALPTNVLLPFLSPRMKSRYAIVALFFLCASLLLHLFRVQVIPLFEISCLLLTMLCVYCRMYLYGRHA